MITHYGTIEVFEGNIKKAVENYLNRQHSLICDDHTPNYQYQTKSKIVLEKLKPLTDIFNFKGKIIRTDITIDTKDHEQNIIGVGICLPSRMEYYRKNIVIKNYILVEYQTVSSINRNGELHECAIIPWEMVTERAIDPDDV